MTDRQITQSFYNLHMPVSQARAAAFDVLLRVETTDAYASELLHSSRTKSLSPADHGLLTEIVMGVLRWRSVLDEQIAAHLDKPLAKLDAEVITALLMGAYQLLFLDRIPAHAAINESVELVKKARKRSATGMVNAVLRKIKRPSAAEAAKHSRALAARLEAVPSRSALGTDPLKPEKSPPNSRSPFASLTSLGRSGQALDSRRRFGSESPSVAQDDSAVNAHPSWLVQQWKAGYGAHAAQAICEYDQQAPHTVIRADTKLLDELASQGIQCDPGSFLRGAYIVTHGDITRTRAFGERRLVIQDGGSQLVALLLGEGKLILDCCAAPGGKTRILAERNPHATVVAMELHAHRATLMSRLVPLPNVHVICADARWMPFATQFDRILVDAPCTGTGTLARNPEIKWRLTPEDISRLQAYQIEILTAAMQKLAPGGQLLYSTCSLEPEENEAVIDRVLRGNSAFRLLDIRDRLTQLHQQGALVCDPDSLVRGSYLRTIPGVHPCDGFFAALLERKM